MKIPTDPKDINALREFLNTIKTQVCCLADCLSEPWKTHFNSLKHHYDEALKALPPTDQVPAAIEANHHLSAFYSCLEHHSHEVAHDSKRGVMSEGSHHTSGR